MLHGLHGCVEAVMPNILMTRSEITLPIGIAGTNLTLELTALLRDTGNASAQQVEEEEEEEVVMTQMPPPRTASTSYSLRQAHSTCWFQICTLHRTHS